MRGNALSLTPVRATCLRSQNSLCALASIQEQLVHLGFDPRTARAPSLNSRTVHAPWSRSQPSTARAPSSNPRTALARTPWLRSKNSSRALALTPIQLARLVPIPEQFARLGFVPSTARAAWLPSQNSSYALASTQGFFQSMPVYPHNLSNILFFIFKIQMFACRKYRVFAIRPFFISTVLCSV